MCTVMLVPETLQAQMTPAAVARKQVDELIRQEQDAILEYRMTKHAPDAMPPIPAGNILSGSTEPVTAMAERAFTMSASIRADHGVAPHMTIRR